MPVDPRELTNALQTAQSGKANQAYLEQTLGRALLQRMEGKTSDLGAIFKEIGGTDPVVSHVLQNMTDKFNQLQVATGTTHLKAVINDSKTIGIARAAACSNHVSLRDMVEYTANTFAKFATPPTSKETFGK